MRANGIAQPRAQLLDQLGLVVAADRQGAWSRVARQFDRAVLLPHEHVPRRQLADVSEDRIRSGNRVEREERLERIEVDLAARQRPQLRRELERAAGVAVVERLDAVAVA